MSDEMLAELKRTSSTSMFSKESLKLIWEAVPAGGTTLALLLIALWLIANWAIGFVVSYDFGWNSRYGNYIALFIVVFSFSCVFIEVARHVGPNSKTKNELKKDLVKKTVKVTEYPIYEAKIFEDPEHGGFIYFIRTFNNKVMALYDSESQNLAIAGRDPTESSYKLRDTLKISRTPHAKFVVGEEFTGKLIDLPKIKVFTDNIDIWPEHADFVRCSWETIDAKYGAGTVTHKKA